jgi:hypothetical protein
MQCRCRNRIIESAMSSKFAKRRSTAEFRGEVLTGLQPALSLIRVLEQGAIHIGFICATAAMLLVTGMISVPAAFAQPMPPGDEQDHFPKMDSPLPAGLMHNIAQLRARIVQIRAALDQGDHVGAFAAEMQPVGAAMATDLPSSPRGLHIYHIGATGFFLDNSAGITLSPSQQAALHGIKQTSISDLAAAQRQIDRAEQELWLLTGSDAPEPMTLETKVRYVESLKAEQRYAFIRSVGEAAGVLTNDQRAALLGTAAAPGTAPMNAPQGAADSVKSGVAEMEDM